jgi:hypothetical protein
MLVQSHPHAGSLHTRHIAVRVHTHRRDSTEAHYLHSRARLTEEVVLSLIVLKDIWVYYGILYVLKGTFFVCYVDFLQHGSLINRNFSVVSGK